MEAKLSVEKVGKLCDLLRSFQGKKICTKRELLSLVGSLSFSCKVVLPGRSFLSRIIALSCTVKKLYHKVYLNSNVRQDFELWCTFLTTWNGKEFFLDEEETLASDLEFYTDAAGTQGFGGCFNKSWFFLGVGPCYHKITCFSQSVWPSPDINLVRSAGVDNHSKGTLSYCNCFISLGPYLGWEKN